VVPTTGGAKSPPNLGGPRGLVRRNVLPGPQELIREIPVAKIALRCDNRKVPVEGHLYGERVWFHDARGQVRRMGVSGHPADSTMVISLWQGDVCTGTFRLPAADAARLISTLAYGMSESIADRPATSSGPGRGPLRDSWIRLIRRVFTRSTGPGETHLRLLP
jgi:hypothetical protein